jgi:hypothetical protein
MPLTKFLLRTALLLPVLSSLFIGCGQKEETGVEIPANVLNEARFTKLLTDFALAESAATMNIKNVLPHKADSVYAFNPLIDNTVRPSQYDSTLAFYIKHPALYKKVYENVLTALTVLEASREEAKAAPDSK